jgi:hypothetical protein
MACGEAGGPNQDIHPYTCNDSGVCFLTGTLTEDLTLTADRQWVLRGGVFIGDDENRTVLTVEPGTRIYGESSTNGMLIITRGSRLMAEGTRERPIVFSSSKTPGTRSRGDWGGVIINGRAGINNCAEDSKTEGLCEAFGEGGTGWYGGSDDRDNSGVLRFVRIEFAGRIISPDNELNGLALQGVGDGTVLDHLQIHMNKDDGIEFFGGACNFKRVLITGVADDNLDWTDGWRGKGQFLVAQQYEDAGDNGIEGDNNAENNQAEPRSRPLLSNITLIGNPQSEHSDLGILVREGTAARIHNTLVLGWNDACLRIDHAETFANAVNAQGALSGELVLQNSIMSCASPFKAKADDPFTIEAFFTTMNSGNLLADPLLVRPFDLANPDYRPGPGSPARSGAQVPDDSFFERVTFKGGVDPDDDWTAGWTIHERS